MALVPEDGTGLSTADSFCSQAEATTYFTAQASPSDWTDATSAQKDSALRYAARWLGAHYSWPGWILSLTQRLQWPRTGAYDSDGRNLSTWSVVKDLYLIPAQCEIAGEHLRKAINLARAASGEIKSVTIDVLSVTYMDHAPLSAEFDGLSYVDEILAPVVGAEEFSIRTARG